MADFRHYQVRIHRTYDDVGTSLLQFSDKSNISFTFEHPADEEVSRIHIHQYNFDLSIKYDAISARIKKLGLKGNSDFSVSGTCGKDKRPLDLSGAWMYGSKFGTIAPKYVKNLTPEQVEQLNEYARFKIPQGVTVASVGSVPQQPKEKLKTRHQHITEVALEVLTPEYVKLAPRDPQRIRIVRDTCLSYMRNHQIFCGKWKTVEFIESVLLNIGDESFFDAVSTQLEKNLGHSI